MYIGGFRKVTDDIIRSKLFADILSKRQDKEQRRIIDEFADDLNFEPIARLMVSSLAWSHVKSIGIAPRAVFAHPDILRAHPTTSLYYRGLALLSRKRVGQAAVSVNNWEDGTRKQPVQQEAAKKIACLYNTMISSIIEGSSDWTLDDGYRNILATMGIMLDGMFRNRIGEAAETLIKNQMMSWLQGQELIPSNRLEQGLRVGEVDHFRQEYVPSDSLEQGLHKLPKDTIMRFGSEPDIEFIREGRRIATIEIKGGRDPAGALERLGAMSKSFAETPPGCANFLVAGVITTEMQTRLVYQHHCIDV